MSTALFFTHVCKFGNCGLNFASSYDLIQHIEEIHIRKSDSAIRLRSALISAAFELEQKKKETQQSSNCQTQTVPLSVIFRMFPVLPSQRPKPIKADNSGCSFNHNKKRTGHPTSSLSYHPNSAKQAANTDVLTGNNTKADSTDRDDEMSSDYFREDFEDWYDGGSEERKYKCPVSGCNRRYKNLQGARYHAKQAHGISDNSDTPPTSSTSRPFKCNQCSKRYKTQSGLQNHCQLAHRNCSALVPVSPSAVSDDRTGSNLVAQQLQSTKTKLIAQQQQQLSRNSPQQNIQTAPPPIAGGHQYHQTTALSSIASVNVANRLQTTRIPSQTSSAATGLSFTVPIMPTDGKANSNRRLSNAAMTAASRQQIIGFGSATSNRNSQPKVVMSANNQEITEVVVAQSKLK